MKLIRGFFIVYFLMALLAASCGTEPKHADPKKLRQESVGASKAMKEYRP